MNTATTTYPACSGHAEHNDHCNACYMRLEHAQNQASPTGRGHVVYRFEARCEDCAAATQAEAIGELMQGEAPEGSETR